jgi:hypothetical protein
MSISKSWTRDPQNIKHTLALYRSPELPTLETIAKKLETSYQNVQFVVKKHLTKDEYSAHKKVRYSVSKTGDLNPMKDKTGKKHHNWVGECENHKGYLTIVVNQKRVFVHRHVMAKALGLKKLPGIFDVHHIDGDTRNNDLNNLVLCTKTGHHGIHFLQVETETARLKRSTIAVVLKSMMSQ